MAWGLLRVHLGPVTTEALPGQPGMLSAPASLCDELGMASCLLSDFSHRLCQRRLFREGRWGAQHGY